MELFSDSIQCTSCKKILTTPVFLPCGHSICYYHIEESRDKNTLLCVICNEDFDIPSNGFPPARALESLLKKNIQNIDLGEEYNSARDKCSLFGDLLDQFNKIKNDPEMRISEVISDLKNKFDLRREEMKQNIDKQILQMIDELNEFEKECKFKVASVKSDPKLDEKLKKWQINFKEWQQRMRTFERSDNWKKILDESTSTIKHLHSEFLNFDRNLFLDRLNQFKCSASNNLVTLIKYEVKELTKYLDTKESKVFISPSVNIDGIDWSIQVHIVKPFIVKSQDKRDIYVDIYLHVLQNPFIRNINVDYDLAILDQFDMNRSIIKYGGLNVFGIGKTNTRGFERFIVLKDLIANANLYNARNDSCAVQAIIKKFDWV